MSDARTRKFQEQILQDEIVLSVDEEILQRLRDQRLDSYLEFREDGSIQIKEQMMHVEDLAYFNTVENFFIRLLSVLHKFNTEIVFFEIHLVHPNHSFKDFDKDDWNKIWNNSETYQFLPRTVKFLDIDRMVSPGRGYIEILDSVKYVYDDAKEALERFGYFPRAEDFDNSTLKISFPLNRIRNICFRVISQK